VIAVVLDQRCISCGRCVEVCPTDVLEIGADGYPRIARVLDCQTCFICELHCPADALYVDPACEVPRPVAEQDALNAPSLGEYRRHAGWGERPEENPNEFWLMERAFAWVFAEIARERAAAESGSPPG
jgi:NAD-dependent dihydropyrimidine dehydrogenase PreA subunit